jgi:hypothetical protein
MTHSLRLAAVILAAALRAAAAEPALEFSGVLLFPTKTLIALKDTATGASKWIEPGRTFASYTLVSYEAKDEIIVVSHGAETFRLKLKDAKVQSDQIADLRHASRGERQRVWDAIKDLEGQALIEALIANGSVQMRKTVESMRPSTHRLNETRPKLAAALARTDLSDEKRAALEDADRKLVESLNASQTLLEKEALRNKRILQESLSL